MKKTQKKQIRDNIHERLITHDPCQDKYTIFLSNWDDIDRLLVLLENNVSYLLKKKCISLPDLMEIIQDRKMNIEGAYYDIFFWAIETDNCGFLEWLVKNIDVSAFQADGLLQAARTNKINIAKILLDNGADVAAINNAAVRYGAGNGHLEIVKYLVSKGADIDARDYHALTMARDAGHQQIVDYLTSENAGVAA